MSDQEVILRSFIDFFNDVTEQTQYYYLFSADITYMAIISFIAYAITNFSIAKAIDNRVLVDDEGKEIENQEKIQKLH